MVIDLPGVFARRGDDPRRARRRPAAPPPPPPPPPPPAADRPPASAAVESMLDPSRTIAIKAWFYGTTLRPHARFVPITTDTWPCGVLRRRTTPRTVLLRVPGARLQPAGRRRAACQRDAVPRGAHGGTITLRASAHDGSTCCAWSRPAAPRTSILRGLRAPWSGRAGADVDVRAGRVARPPARLPLRPHCSRQGAGRVQPIVRALPTPDVRAAVRDQRAVPAAAEPDRARHRRNRPGDVTARACPAALAWALAC